MNKTIISYDQVKKELLSDPEVRAAYEALQPAHQITRLRLLRGLTQEEVAQMVGTQQPSIARLESGKGQPSLALMRRVVEALGGTLTITIQAPQDLAQRKAAP